MWHDIDEKIISVKGFCLSSKYKGGKIFGQKLNLKTIGFIEITSDSGTRGFGENYASIYIPELLPSLVDFLEKYLVGKKVGNKNLMNEIYQIPFIGKSGILRSVSGSIEIALWDLRGKLLDKPINQLLSKKRDKLPCYSSGGSVIMSSKEIEEDVNQSLNDGFDAYKMRIGYQSWKNDLERIESAKKNLNNKILMLDAIMGTLRPAWSLEDALKKIKDLSKFKPRWIEEPLNPENISELNILKKNSKVPIAAGEAYSGKLEYDLIIKNKSVDVLQFDCTHSGGIDFCMQLSKDCLKNKIECAVHVWGSPVAIAANTHMSYCLESIIYVEIPKVKLEISDFMWVEPPKIKKGQIELSDAPGLGVEITEDIKNKFPFVKGTGFKI